MKDEGKLMVLYSRRGLEPARSIENKESIKLIKLMRLTKLTKIVKSEGNLKIRE